MASLLIVVKMFICSTALYAYYWFFLRNKKFHHYNRFFLLFTAAVSIVFPFLNIHFLVPASNEDVPVLIQAIQTISVNRLGVETQESLVDSFSLSTLLTARNLLVLFYAMLMVILTTRLLRSLIYIQKIRSSYPSEQMGDLTLYDTTEAGTPFSFFKSIFWNRDISLKSQQGQQIFRHELFHVRQRHSVDILVMEILCVIAWFNPVFHLIKKELRAIHEFLADQYAVSENDRYAYAELLVMESIRNQQLSIGNSFFHSHIKRRIAMILQLKNKNYGYWNRLMPLPLIAILFCGIAVYAGQSGTSQKNKKDISYVEKSGIDTIPEKEQRKREAELEALMIKQSELRKKQEEEMLRLIKQQETLIQKMASYQQQKEMLRIFKEKKLSKQDIEKLMLEEKINNQQLTNLQHDIQKKQAIEQELQLYREIELNKLSVARKKELQEKQIVLAELLKELKSDKSNTQLALELELQKKQNEHDQRKQVYEELQKEQSIREETMKLLEEQNKKLFKEFDSAISEIRRYFLRNLRYPAEALNAGKEGDVYVLMELDEHGVLKDYQISKDQALLSNHVPQGIAVVAYAPRPGTAGAGQNIAIEPVLNAEVERAVKKYAPITKGRNYSPKRLYFKIEFRLEKQAID